MRVAVIGAGVSGLAAARAFDAAGLEVVVFEDREDVGGVWSASRRYPGVRTQNDKRSYAFSDLPMPADYEEYPSGSAIQSYLASYASHHRLDRLIRLGTRVERAAMVGDGVGWDVTVDASGTRRTERFDWLVVATGICSMPNVPSYPGQEAFTAAGGAVLPSTSLSDGEVLRDRDVVVVGYGKSAADIAVAATSRSRSVVVLARNIAWKLPLRIGRLTFQRVALTRLGEHVLWAPTRSIVGKVVRRLDQPIRRRLVARLERRIRQDLQLDRRDLVPGGPLTEFTHLVTPGFFEAIDADAIRLVKGVRITALGTDDRGRYALLSDGSRLPADVVVTATGFDQDLGFLDESARSSLLDDDGELGLYLHTLPERVPRLAFIGWSNSFRSPIGAEMQALWVTALLLGRATPPPQDVWREGRRAYRLSHAAAAAKGEPQFSHGASITDFDRWIAEAGVRMPSTVRLRELVTPLDPAAYAPLLGQVLERGPADRRSVPNGSAEAAGGR